MGVDLGVQLVVRLGLKDGRCLFLSIYLFCCVHLIYGAVLVHSRRGVVWHGPSVGLASG